MTITAVTPTLFPTRRPTKRLSKRRRPPNLLEWALLKAKLLPLDDPRCFCCWSSSWWPSLSVWPLSSSKEGKRTKPLKVRYDPVLTAQSADYTRAGYVPHNSTLQFGVYAEEVVKALEIEQISLREDIEAFATSIVSHTTATGATWPFVTIPDFERRGAIFNKLAESSFVGLFPLVTENTRAAYEEFSISQQSWISEGLGVQGLSPELTTQHANISSFIFHTRVNEQNNTDKYEVQDSLIDFGPADYVPIWQQAPAPSTPALINYDILQHDLFRRNFKLMWDSGTSIQSKVAHFDFTSMQPISPEKNDPASMVLHPIYPYFLDNSTFDKNDLVAVLVVAIHWKDEFENILRQGKQTERVHVNK
jgi:hypothetical protein